MANAVKEIAKFIKRNAHLLECYATMDEIPGEFGKQRTQKQVEDSAKKSYDNQQELKSLGVKPIPISESISIFALIALLLFFVRRLT